MLILDEYLRVLDLDGTPICNHCGRRMWFRTISEVKGFWACREKAREHTAEYMKAFGPKIRREVMERNGGGLCVVDGCGKPARQAAHIIPHRAGGGYVSENLVPVCGPSHNNHVEWNENYVPTTP